jgi:uncharacterized membrane protein YeaQ/YmgE (transglycosylase-associated protein family)
VIGVIVSTLLAAFVIGALARWAVPGPDPMPVWMTTGFGLVGALAGTGIAAAAFGAKPDSDTVFAQWLISILVASGLVIAHRRFVQHRPIVGPDAKKPPSGYPGSKRILGPPGQDGEPDDDVDEQIRKLAELRDDGLLTDEEFEAKKALLRGRAGSTR